MLMETIIYVDGYNLFYGCLKHSDYKWLDLYVLFEKILRAQNPEAELVSIRFFTANIKAKVASRGQEAHEAQQRYHRALLTRYPEMIEIIKGDYSLDKATMLAYQKPIDKTHRVDVWKLEEKKTDVNIALSAYRDACKGVAEQLVFVSNDTDIAPALSALREDYGDSIRIGVVIPVRMDNPHRPANKQLSQYANWTRTYIRDEELSESQLPQKIPTKKKPITKPEYW